MNKSRIVQAPGLHKPVLWKESVMHRNHWYDSTLCGSQQMRGSHIDWMIHRRPPAAEHDWPPADRQPEKKPPTVRRTRGGTIRQVNADRPPTDRRLTANRPPTTDRPPAADQPPTTDRPPNIGAASPQVSRPSQPRSCPQVSRQRTTTQNTDHRPQT